MGKKIDFSLISFMIVDDHGLSARIVRDILSHLGATDIQQFSDAERAFHQLGQLGTDIVITERRLNGLNGVEFLNLIRNSPESPNRFLPVIMLTAYADEEYVREARDEGITEFLAKPFTAASLFKRLVSVIAQPRPFIQAESFFRPDRRRKQKGFSGNDRRAPRDRT